MPYSRDSGISTTRFDGKNVRLTGNSGLDPLIISEKTLTIEAPDLQLSIYPSQNGTLKILKANAATLASFDASTSSLNMNSNKITGLADGVNPTDAVSKSQMDAAVSGISSSRIQNSTNTTSVEAGSTNVVISSGTATTTTTPSQFFIDNATGSLYLSHSPSSNTFAIERAGSNIWAIQTGAGGEMWNYSSKYVFKGVSGGLDVFTVLTGATPSVALNGFIDMNSNKITELANGTVSTDAVNKGQMDTAISTAVSGISPFSISRAGGSVVCETTGFITYNGAAGTGHNFKVNAVNKAVLGDNTFETYTDVVNFQLPVSGYMSVKDSGATNRFVVDTGGSLITARYNIDLGNSYRLTGLAAGVNPNDSVNKSQMETAITGAVGGISTFQITRGGGSATAETTGQMTINSATGQSTLIQVNAVDKVAVSSANVRFYVPIQMGSNKITDLVAGTVNTDAVNKGQMDTAITTALSPYALTSALASYVLTSTLASYSTTTQMNTAITTALSPYALSSALASYVLTSTLASYSTIAQMNTAITTALSPYSTTTQMNTAITTALSPYSTTTQMNTAITTALSPYSTTTQMNTAITTALSPYSTTTQMNTAISLATRIINGSGDITVGSSGQITATIPAGQFYDILVGGTRYARFSASNGGLGVSGIQSQSMSFTSQSPYVSGAVISPFMNITEGTVGAIFTGGAIKTDLKMNYGQIVITGKASGNTPFIITDYLGTTNKFLYDEANDRISILSANGLLMNSKKITSLLAGSAGSTDACNVVQMETYVAGQLGGISSYQISRSGFGSIVCEANGQISYNGYNVNNASIGFPHVFKVSGNTKMIVDNATFDVYTTSSFNLPASGYFRVNDSTGATKFQVNTGSSSISIAYPISTTSGINMNTNSITGLLGVASAGYAVEYNQLTTLLANYALSSSVADAIARTHNAYEIVRGTTNLTIDAGGVLTLTMPLNTSSFNITDPSNTGINMSSWTTQTGVSYQTNRCRTRVQSPSSSTPYLQTWFNSGGTEPEILSSTGLNIAVSGATDHINFRHSTTSLIATMASDYFDTYLTGGHRIYNSAGTLKYTLSTNGTDPTLTTASDNYSINSKVVFQNATNSTTAYRFKTSLGSAFIDIDTTNQVLNMNTHKITGILAGSSSGEAVEYSQLSSYLTTATAASTYLTSATAASTYLTSATAASTYLTTAAASSTYATITSLSSYLTTATASSTYATIASVSNAISKAHNSYEITGSSVAYARISSSGAGDDLILNSGAAGAVWAYYAGSPKFVVGSSGHEVYVADTGFKWLKGSTAGTEMYKLYATTTTQTIVDIATDNLLQKGNMAIRPYTTHGETLIIANTAGASLAAFNTSASDQAQYLDMKSHLIRAVKDPLLAQDAATKKYVDDMTEMTYKQCQGLVRNPDMDINQRQISSLRVGQYIDGWKAYHENLLATSGQEEIGDLLGFRWCSRVITTGASNSLVHNYCQVEGTMTRDLQLGYTTVGLTLSAWVKSTVANHKFCFGQTISYGSGYEICSSATTGAANTWVRVSASFPACPSGVIPTTGTGVSVNWSINPSVPSGTTWGYTNQTWVSLTSGRALGLSDGTTNMLNVAGTFRFTGFQVDVGDKMLPYRPQSYQQKLLHAQRYFNRIRAASATHYMGIVGRYDTTYTIGQIVYPTQMRITPAWTINSGTYITVERGTGATVASTNVVPFGGTTDIMTLLIVAATGNDGSRWWLNSASAYMDLDADL